MQHFIITNDLHQHPSKWAKLANTVVKICPQFVLITGDILPKQNGLKRQREFLPFMRELLTKIKDKSSARVLLYLSNDDAHFLEPLIDDLEADGLCVNMNQRVYREAGLVFCGMNKVRDYPFGYKHYCVPDGAWIADPIQFYGQGITFDENEEQVDIADLQGYLLSSPNILAHLENLKGQIHPGEMAKSVWMVHMPPSNLGMDICSSGKQVGSPTLLQFIEDNQPLLGCSGHIHESPHMHGGSWQAQVGKTIWVQPGQEDARLHYVTLDITDDYKVENIKHSVFGEGKIE